MGGMNQRRSFLARFGAAAAAFGLTSAAEAQPAAAQQGAPDSRWQAAREPKDDWFDRLPGRHRLFFDATSPKGAQEAGAFASNFYTANRNDYELNDGDLAVVICLRHHATPFAYNDALWAKYSAGLAEAIKFMDPKTDQPAAVNLYRSSFEGLIKHGVHFAVCNMATHRIAGVIARHADSKADDVYKELVAGAIANTHFVPAGIVAVNRAQERGYAIAHSA
jgi:intracellular sulfur oxidation DsrE/DsrF family protein